MDDALSDICCFSYLPGSYQNVWHVKSESATSINSGVLRRALRREPDPELHGSALSTFLGPKFYTYLSASANS